jgi:hypothetical protein
VAVTYAPERLVACRHVHTDAGVVEHDAHGLAIFFGCR